MVPINLANVQHEFVGGGPDFFWLHFAQNCHFPGFPLHDEGSVSLIDWIMLSVCVFFSILRGLSFFAIDKWINYLRL